MDLITYVSMMSAMPVPSNFNGLVTFGTMKISSRHGLFEPVTVDYSGRSGGFIGTLLDFL